MRMTTVQCGWCGKEFQKENRELNRIRRMGRTVVYCSRSCGKCAINKENPHIADAGRRHLKKWNAQHSQDPWRQHHAHLSSQGWKYAEIEAWLRERGIDYIFEYPIIPFDKLYLFDLYIPILNLVIEFDGPHHCGAHLMKDVEKEMAAHMLGYRLVRVTVEQNVVYSVGAISWIFE